MSDPKTKPSGGQKGNRNSIRHGLTAGKLPRDAKHIEVKMNLLRRGIEAEVIRIKGEIVFEDACLIQTALKWERHGALCLRWLTKDGQQLGPETRLHFSREIAKASAERDKAIMAIGLKESAKKMPWVSTARIVSVGGNGHD